MKHSNFKRFLFLLSLFSFGLVQAQGGITVSGTVQDESGPLPGVNVVLLDNSKGTSTDFDGNFTLSGVDPQATIVFSYVGFKTVEVPVNNRSTLNVTLELDSQSLEEIVVVGYGTQSRSEVTGAIATIEAEEISSLPVARADEALQGRAPGVSVVSSGSPGNQPVIRIRGLGTPNSNDPLYVIDGTISGGMGNLNPNDIESIQVLKDASTTAVYGSKGSNGVVIITTKKGKPSEKATLSFDSYSGVNFISDRYDVLNVEQYNRYASEIGPTPDRISNSAYESLSSHNTNWQDEIFRTGFIQSYNLALAGGNENSNFRFSGGYLGQEGAMIETDYERFNFRANSQFTFGNLTIGESFGVSFDKQHPERESGGRSILEHAIKIAPYLPVYNPDNLGGFQGPSSSLDLQDAENPVRAQTLGEVVNKSININGGIFASYELFDALTFKTQVGLDYSNGKNSSFIPSYSDDETSTNSTAYAQINKNTSIYQSLTYTNSLTYTKTFGDYHNLELLALAEQQKIKFENVNARSTNDITDAVNQLSINGVDLSSGATEYLRIGYLGRVNYNFDKRYLFSASIRRDASSRFGANNRWGYFPSVSAGWNIGREAFMEGSAINNLKLRGSWGITGNDNIGDYLYSSTLLTNFIYPIGGAAVQGTTANGLANPDLKWEETTMRNIGLDVGINDNKFTFTLEYYNNKSDDLLVDLPLPLSHGYNNPNLTSNVGSVKTQGFEFNFGYNDYEGDFTWSANMNISHSKNEVVTLNSSGESSPIFGAVFEGESLSAISINEPLFHFYGYQFDGIYQNEAEVDAVLSANPNQDVVHPGDVRYKDLNGDGEITSADKMKIGNPYPDLVLGLNLSANYKNFDFNAFITGSYGNDLYNTNLYDLHGMTRLFNSGVAVLDRWTGPGTSNTIPRALGATQNTSASDRFIEDGSYTKFKNITIGYTIPTDFFNDAISKFRIYMSGQNLITITDYSGLDPEIGLPSVNNGGVRNQFELGIDRGNYPQPKSVVFGLQLEF